MNTVTAHATGSRSSTDIRGSSRGSAIASPGVPATLADPRTARGSQTSSARTAGTAQNASAPRHDPSSTVMSGTVKAAAAAAPTNSAVEYSPIIRPIRCAKSCLITAGMQTFATAIPAPTSTVPPKSATGKSRRRVPMPTATTTIVSASSRCSPIRRVSVGVRKAKAPKANTGIVVSRPAAAEGMPRSRSIARSTGPTEATPIRRFSAINSSPTPT